MRATGLRPLSRALDSLVSTTAAAPSEIDDDGRRGDRAFLGESGLQLRDLVGTAAARRFVGVDLSFARAALDRDRHDLVLEPAVVDRILGAAQALDRIIVHLLAGQLIFVGGALGEAAHRAAFLVRILEPVEEHMVVSGVVADARARAVLLEQVRRVGHRSPCRRRR